MQSGDALVKSRGGRGLLSRLGGGLLDLVYPPTCLDCGAPVASADALCPDCFRRLRPISAPFCPRLGIPFAVSLGEGGLSAEALADPPPYDRARSAVVYNEVARALVGRLKYGDRPELAGFCARLMVAAGAELWGDRPVLVPVPLAPRRRLKRRYNQSAELARVLGRLTGLAVDPALVRRTRHTRQQVGLSGEARRRNVAGAFSVHPEASRRLAGRRIVLVDDVITTGSTVAAVARTLNRAGIDRVDVVSFARVVVGEQSPI